MTRCGHLQDMLKMLDLPLSGTKDEDLVDRAINFFEKPKASGKHPLADEADEKPKKKTKKAKKAKKTDSDEEEEEEEEED